jgi:hypothetical protein
MFLMKRILFMLMLSLAVAAQAQFQKGTRKALIPAGWTVFNEVAGDLNKDSLVDMAIIVESPTENEEGEKPRSLLLLLKNSKKDDTYTLACQADKVILGAQSGGTIGDPFSGMEINKRGVLKIDFFGGSREKWSITHRYRYDKNYFAVIGATYSVDDGGYVSETWDYNVANGNVIITKKDTQNKANSKTTNMVKKIITPELSRFEPDALWGLLDISGYAKTSNCKIVGAGSGDCFHLEFDCKEFVNADTYLDAESQKLWDSLTVPAPADDVQPNPAYANTVFEITYVEKMGVKCEPQGPAPYQLVVGFKIKK